MAKIMLFQFIILAENLPNLVSDNLSMPVSLYNRDIITKYHETDKISSAKWLQIHHSKFLSTVNLSENNLPGLSAYERCVNRLIVKYERLLKDRSRLKGAKLLAEFLDTKFISFPKRGTKRSNTSEPCTQDVTEGVFKQVAESLGKEISSKNTEIADLKDENEQLVLANVCLESKKSKLDDSLYEKQVELKRTASREDYYRKKCAKFSLEASQNDFDLHIDCSAREFELLQNLKEAKQEIADLQCKNDQLSEKLVEIEASNSPEVKTFDTNTKTFTPELQKCIFELLQHHVSSSHVSPVIQSCLNLVGKKANKLPSVSTVNNINIQRAWLSQKQMSEVLPSKEYTTLYTDETSKFGSKFGAYAASDMDGNYYVLGLRDLPTKSAKDTLHTFKEILQDIDSRINLSESEVSKQILVNIRNTMSDKAATETKFNTLLEIFRKETLPKIIEGHNIMSREDTLPLDKMCNFFCGLHSLVHMAETTKSAFNEIEKGHYDSQFNNLSSKNGEGRAFTLIRLACKSFARGADEKSGCHGPFVSFVDSLLKENGFHSLPLTPFRGNRFNILFVNASYIYFLREEMKQFLNFHTLNKMTSIVKTLLEDNFLVASLRALGLVSKFVTTPLWNILEKKEIHIFDMNKKYLELLQFLESALGDLDSFLKGDMSVFSDCIFVKKDAVFHSLTQSNDTDSDTVLVLQILLPALIKLVQHEFKDHLPGGKFENFEEKYRTETKSVAKHNKYVEFMFGYFDQLLRFKPNVSTLAAEAYLTFAQNKTLQWLQQKTADEQQLLLKSARQGVVSIRAKFKSRQQNIREARLAKLREEKLAQEMKLAKSLRDRELETNDVIYWGLWQTVEQIDDSLKNIKSDSEKIEGLKAQLRFRKNVLKQEYSDKSIFNFSVKSDTTSKRENLKWEELRNNLKKLVQHSYSNIQENNQGDRVRLVGRRISHKFIENSVEVWYSGRVVSQVFCSSTKLSCLSSMPAITDALLLFLMFYKLFLFCVLQLKFQCFRLLLKSDYFVSGVTVKF